MTSLTPQVSIDQLVIDYLTTRNKFLKGLKVPYLEMIIPKFHLREVEKLQKICPED